MFNEIIKYVPNQNGTYDVTISDVFLNDKQIQEIKNGGLPVNLSVVDPNYMTDRQRSFIFALLSDIEKHTGQPREYMRKYFQDYIQFVNGYEKPISLSVCSKKIATEIIDTILTFIFKYDIPINFKTSTLMRNDQSFLYLSTISRKCVICGRSESDLAHHYHIGRGRNRQTMSHEGFEVLALCREHHNQQHKMGIDTFDKHYGLADSWLKVDDRLNAMLKGQLRKF